MRGSLAQLFSQTLASIQRHEATLWKWTSLAVVSFFLAKAVSLWVGYKYLPIEVKPLDLASRDSDFNTAGEVNLGIILSRNLFNSTAGKGTPTRGPVGGEIFPTTLNSELLGTIAFRNAKFSVALIKERGAKEARYYGINEMVEGAAIRKIERFRVVVENNGRLEALELKAAESKIQGVSSVFSSFSSEPTQDLLHGEFEEVGPNRFVVPQGVVDDALKNFNQILTQARMIPNMTSDGRPDGFKVIQIKPGSIYERLNLRNNDVIKRVNGQELDNIEKALGLFSALRNEKTISLDIVRDGTRLNYTYDIR